MPNRGAYPDLDPPARPVPDRPSPVRAAEAGPGADTQPRLEGAPEKKKKEKDLGRGVETMFRTSYRMHVDLAGLADSKANILISINGLSISVMLAAMVPRIGEEVWLFLPTSVVLLTSLASISLAVLAARPRVSRPAAGGTGTGADAGGVGENLMFFGGFLSLSAEAYRAAVAEAIRQPERLYDGMARDIYGLGLVLDRKFRLLRMAYTVFMFGLATGVVLYLIVYLLLGLGDAGSPIVAVNLHR